MSITVAVKKFDADHGSIHNLDVGWQCSPPEASVSLQKIGNVIHTGKFVVLGGIHSQSS